MNIMDCPATAGQILNIFNPGGGPTLPSLVFVLRERFFLSWHSQLFPCSSCFLSPTQFLAASFPLPRHDNQRSGSRCDDGAMNGDETGVDCGGSCPACCGPSFPFQWIDT